MIKWLTIVALAGLLLTAVPAWAQEESTEDESAGSGLITFEDLSQNLVVCATEFEGIVVLYVLPKGWEGAEQGVDRQTGKLDEELNRYVLLSRSPMADENEAPDMVFELSIFRQGLPEDWDEGLSEDEKQEMEESAFWDFIDAQMSQALKDQWHCVTPQSEIQAKPYGTGTRAPTFFVPVFYEREGKVNIYTFTSITSGKIWMLKFLVKAEQADNYGALIALILNNTFAMPKEKFEEYQRSAGREVPQTPESK
jgi:hypothetical protein